MTPLGQALGGIREETYWCSAGVAGSGFELANTVESQVAELENRREFLNEFCSTGGSVELFIGWFTNEKNSGETFDWQLLQRLAALHVDLAFDVYGGQDPPGVEEDRRPN